MSHYFVCRNLPTSVVPSMYQLPSHHISHIKKKLYQVIITNTPTTSFLLWIPYTNSTPFFRSNLTSPSTIYSRSVSVHNLITCTLSLCMLSRNGCMNMFGNYYVCFQIEISRMRFLGTMLLISCFKTMKDATFVTKDEAFGLWNFISCRIVSIVIV